MPFNINNYEEDSRERSEHLVYKSGVQVKFPDKNKEIEFCVLPALPKEEEEGSQEFLEYRDPERNDEFTNWVEGAAYYPFVNGEKSILDPRTIGKEWDPIADLIKAAKSKPKYCEIAGCDEKGKRLPDAWKNEECKLPNRTIFYVVNAIITNDRDVDGPVILQIPKTAMCGQSSHGKGAPTWGMISVLDHPHRVVPKGDAEYDEIYYWGDVTKPSGMLPFTLKLCQSPTGGSIKLYNVLPSGSDAEPVRATKQDLRARRKLDDIFYPIEEKEILDYLIHTFSYAPDLLRLAFRATVPNIDKLISAAGRKYSFSADDADDDADVDDGGNDRPTGRAAKRGSTAQEDDEAEGDPVPAARKKSYAPPVDEDDEEELPKPRRASAAKKAPTARDEEEEDEIDMTPAKPAGKRARRTSDESDSADEVEERAASGRTSPAPRSSSKSGTLDLLTAADEEDL